MSEEKIDTNPEKELEETCERCNKPLDWTYAVEGKKGGHICLDCYTSEIDRGHL